MPSDGKTSHAMNQPSNSPSQDLEALLDALWKSNHATILERVKTLRDAQNELAIGQRDDQTRKNAEAAAHKLAGVLGTFGLPEGSKLASKIEVLLAQETPLSAESEGVLGVWLDRLEGVIASKPRESKV